MMSFDIGERQKELFDILKTGAVDNKYAQLSYFSPKQYYIQESITYYVYIQPFLVLCFIAWLIVLIYALWTEEYLKKYGFMTLYSCLDIFMIGAQNIVLIYVFTLEENYVQFEMCYVYQMAADVVLHVLFLVSQWIKVCQSFQKYLILKRPITYKDIFNKLYVGTFLTITIIVGLSVGVGRFLFNDFEKVVTIDRKTMKTIDICRHRSAFSAKVMEIPEYEYWFEVGYCIVAAFIPVILMLISGILSIKALRKQVKFRKRFNINQASPQNGLERLVKVTTTVTLCFVFLTLPRLMVPVATKMNNVLLVTEYFSFIYAIFFMLNIPINFLLFSWVSAAFREKMRQIWTCFRRRSSD